MNCNKLPATLLVFIFLLLSGSLFAQLMPPKTVKVAVLTPLYLDSAFSDYTYKLGNINMPQYILSGLDFYNGVMMAVDSLNKENINAEVWIYDTKKIGTNINTMLAEMKPLGFSLIIASFTNAAEQKAASEFSFANNIPVVSVTYPNEAGIMANPYFIMLNSTLKTHVDAIYNYVQQNFLATKPLFVTKFGALETRILDDFRSNDSLVRFHFPYKVLSLKNEVVFNNLKPYLDSTKQNVIVCGSLNGDFAVSLVQALGSNAAYKVTLIGMPDWDGMRKVLNNSFDNIDIVYSTAFNYPADDPKIQDLASQYKLQFYARPSDLVYKGFEAMYHFTHLVNDYRNELLGHISDTSYTWSNRFIMKPVMPDAQAVVPDYLENKNLFFVKKNKGDTLSVVQLKKPGL